jgi:O-antigen ligase
VSALRPLSRRSPAWLSASAAAAVAWLAGGALAAGGIWQVATIALAAVVVGALVVGAALPRLTNGFLSLEVPIVLLLLSGLVWRSRSAESLASNPLDAAGLVRLACVGLAGLLGTLACLAPTRSPGRVTSLSFRLYAMYVLVVFAGALSSVKPGLTAYRGVELVAGLVVIIGAYRRLPHAATPRVEATLYWFLVAMIASIWLGVALFPDQAIGHFSRTTPLPWNIEGVYPSISANGVGTLGVLLTVWSLTRWRQERVIRYVLAVVGVVTLLAAQYRTGYAALTLGLAVLLLLRRRWALAACLFMLAIGIVVWEPRIVSDALPYVLRGDTVHEAKQLDSRVDWWQAALPIWRESPLIGRGLLTGTRFEVLDRMGLGEVSSIHGTWIEALVGTGLIGLSLLIACYVTAFRGSWAAARRHGWCVPVLLLVVLGVRSLTGPTFESFGQHTLLLLWVTVAVANPRLARVTAPSDSEPRIEGLRPGPLPSLPYGGESPS